LGVRDAAAYGFRGQVWTYGRVAAVMRLEFRAVVVMACDDEVIPLQARIETVADDADPEEIYNTERHLLYVACTRAWDHLLVTSVDPASKFLDDLLM
jgi:superfamily I DNA/RNA helicase